MGRKSTFRDDAVFAAVARLLVEAGEARLQGVVAETGVSTGSLYHRFGSREGLLAEAWLDAVGAFQEAFLAALDRGGAQPGLEAALATPRFCRNEPARALILVCCRRSELVCAATPAHLVDRLETVNRKAARAMQDFCARTGIPLETARLGMIGFPLGAVKLYLPARPVPETVDADIARAWQALLDGL
jgi:AcrR family transcriptional regulator